MLWHPTIAGTPGSERLAVHALDEPRATWNLVALVTPSGQKTKTDFENAIDSLRKSGDLARILAHYGIDATPMAAAPVSAHPENMMPAYVMKAAFVEKTSGSSAPALYTAKQAEAGEYKFAVSCSQCHGIELECESFGGYKASGIGRENHRMMLDHLSADEEHARQL